MFSSKDIFLSAPSGGYTISRSVRLRSSASAYFNRTLTTPTDGKKWTYSVWVKRGILTAGTGTAQQLLSAGSATAFFRFSTTDTLVSGWTGAANLETTQVFRDPSAWYHIMLVVDTTQATSSNRVKYYVNGTQITAFATTDYPTQNSSTTINSAVAHNIGAYTSSTQYLDGYLTEINFIDGQALTPSSFGETDAVTGVWKPKKYAGTYGTNGFYLNFSDNSSNTAATIGKDWSGNGNNWTPNNISVTSGTTYDSMLDTPTPYADGGNGRGNYCVMNPLNLPKGGSMSNGNLLWTAPSAEGQAVGTMYVSSGKYYWEMVENVSGGCAFGIAKDTTNINSINLTAGSYVYYTNGNKYDGGTGSAYGATFTNGDVIGVALDLDAGTLVFYKNNTSQGTAFTGLSGNFAPLIYDGTGAATPTFDANFGQRPFTYTPPTGFKALNTQNLPTPTIANGANYMAASTYTGTGASLSIVNNGNNAGAVSFQPDLVWVKGRSGATDHALYDVVRGVQKQLESNTTTAETTETTGLTAFNSNGFTVGALAQMNTNTATYVGWQWKAGNSAGSSNTSGSITSTVSVNATAGFSIVTYTGNGTANATVGHGLGVSPKLIIIKARTSGSVENWPVYHGSLSAGQFLFLNTTNAVQSADGTFNSSTPVSSTVFQFGSPINTRTNSASYSYVAYCFAEVAGYSKFGTWTNNNSTSGTFTYLGFRPRFILLKNTDNVERWFIFDSSRQTYNIPPPATSWLVPNDSAAEGANGATTATIDLLSNGFKIYTTNPASGEVSFGTRTYIYAAFAENPFKYALAR